MKLIEYIEQLRQKGRMSFTSKEALKELGISPQAFRMSLMRLRRKKALVTPFKNFHLIVPPEYHAFGCLPANLFIPLLMKHLNASYYTCLLSAAALHGAAHQSPQIFQVMVDRRMRPIRCGRIAINFIFKKDLTNIPIQSFNVPTGYLAVSTPETTAMDLLMYPRQAGGINHIATVLTELIEAIDPQKLLSLAKSSKENSWIQRLGYILEKLEPHEVDIKNECINLLKKYIQQTNPSYVSLVGRKIKNFARENEWRIIVNTEIESDI